MRGRIGVNSNHERGGNDGGGRERGENEKGIEPSLEQLQSKDEQCGKQAEEAGVRVKCSCRNAGRRGAPGAEGAEVSDCTKCSGKTSQTRICGLSFLEVPSDLSI